MKWKNTIAWSVLMVCFVSCNQLHGDSNVNESTTYITNDTVSEIRSKVSPVPVAEYVKPINDPLNNWKFAVSVTETKLRFSYILKMKYKELDESDTLRIPNFGIQPRIEIRKGADDYSCIIGFLDKKSEFKEYKQVAIKDNQMKLTTLKRYFVGVYRTESK